MKTKIILIIGLFLLSCSIADSKDTKIVNIPSKEGSIKVFASPETYNLTTKWTNEYGSLNPNVKIKVITAASNNIPRMLSNGSGIGFISDESNISVKNQEIWNIEVAHDVIVPIMNGVNPLMNEIISKGVTTERLAQIFEKSEHQNWGKLLNNSQDIPVHFYVTNDATVLSGLANFIKVSQIKTIGINVVNGNEMISAIQKDPNAMGFCKLIQIVDGNTQNIIENIKLVPIDRNGNGKIDYMENIYDNLQSFSRGVWIGKYPNALSGNIYSVSSGKPKNEAEVAFLKWVLTDGQQYLSKNGYSDLVYSERQNQLDKFTEPDIYTVSPQNSTSAILKVLMLVIIAIVAIGFALDLVFRRIGNKKGTMLDAPLALVSVFDENSVNVPKGLYFDKSHTWAFMKKNGSVKIGIDDFLQHVTGPITRIEMKSPGEMIRKGEKFLTIIRQGKKLNIYSPVSGTIIAQNEILINHSSLLNTAPYYEGWVYMIEPSNWLREIQFLSMAEKYKTWLKVEFSRLKDFFATAFKTPEFAYVVYQDGGSLKDGILADLGPEVWEDFQTKFMDQER